MLTSWATGNPPTSTGPVHRRPHSPNRPPPARCRRPQQTCSAKSPKPRKIAATALSGTWSRSYAAQGRVTYLPAGARNNATAEVYIDGIRVGAASSVIDPKLVDHAPNAPRFGESTLSAKGRLVVAVAAREAGPLAAAARRLPGAEIPSHAYRPGLKVAERDNPDRTGKVIEIRDIEVIPGGRSFRFALVELDAATAFGLPVRHLYLSDALRYRGSRRP